MDHSDLLADLAPDQAVLTVILPPPPCAIIASRPLRADQHAEAVKHMMRAQSLRPGWPDWLMPALLNMTSSLPKAHGRLIIALTLARSVTFTRKAVNYADPYRWARQRLGGEVVGHRHARLRRQIAIPTPSRCR
jgi:hypothetical protein